jgi:hypothetical protein
VRPLAAGSIRWRWLYTDPRTHSRVTGEAAERLKQSVVSRPQANSCLPRDRTRRFRITARFGVGLCVQMMCGWMGQCAGLLDHLYLSLKDFVVFQSGRNGRYNREVLDRNRRIPEKGGPARIPRGDPRAGVAEDRIGTGDCLCAEEPGGAHALSRGRRSDTNGTERSLRGFAIGRNNRIFFVSDNGGKTAAVLRSFVTSHELVKVDPFAWFRDVLGDIAEHPIKRAR